MSSPIPPGREHLIPHLVCSPCSEAMEFYQRAFGAEELGRVPSPDGKRLMHGEMQIGNSVIYLADDFPEYCGGHAQTPLALGGSPVSIHRYVADCDAAFERATQAGASVKMPPADMFWGDRYAVVTDPYGHVWSFATHQSDPTPEEMSKAMQEMFQQQA